MTAGDESVFRLVLEYDGAGFEGWQRQPGEHRTVQGCLIQALEEVTGAPALVTGAGRTDAGVHARGQVASVRVATALSAGDLQRALNGVLPSDVAVSSSQPAPPDYDARRAAKTKLYRYQVWNSPVRSPLREREWTFVYRPLDVAAMVGAAASLVGEHDFASFQAAGSSVKTSVRRLLRADVAGAAGGEIAMEFEGTGFLRHMVRNLVGTLLEVGHGRRGADSLPALLAARDRDCAGPTAPARGLCLVRVDDGLGEGEHSV